MTDNYDFDINELIDSEDDDDIDLSDKHEIENEIQTRLENLCRELWDENTYKRLFKKFYLITRLANLGATEYEIKSDMEMIWEPPLTRGNNKCRDRYAIELDGLLSLAKEMRLLKR